MTIYNFEPKTFTAGETLEWTRTFAPYAPADGWILIYYFRSAAGIGFDAAASAEIGVFRIRVPASDTAPLIPGIISWQAWVLSDAGDEPAKYLVATGECKVNPGLSHTNAGQSIDARSANRRILDALDAQLQNRATMDQQSYTIGNRSLTRIPIVELLELRKYYAQLVANERTRRGSYLKNIGVRFNRES